jgi:hypothetical protein
MSLSKTQEPDTRIDENLLASLRQANRKIWLRNCALLAAALKASKTLEDSNIPCLAFKGMPLAQVYYSNVSKRSMADVDLLVPYDHRGRAYRVLESSDWIPFFKSNLVLRFELEKEATFRNKSGAELDLHWALRNQELDNREQLRAYQDLLFSRSELVKVGATHIRCLGPEDLLVNVCAHGYSATKSGRLQWIVDCAVIWDKMGWPRETSLPLRDCDHSRLPRWDIILESAQMGQVSIPVKHCFETLVTLGFNIPCWVRHELSLHDASWTRRCEITLQSQTPKSLTWWQRALLLYIVSRRQQVPRHPLAFLAAYWGVSDGGSLLKQIKSRLSGATSEADCSRLETVG